MSIKDPVKRRLYQRKWHQARKREALPKIDHRRKFNWQEIREALATGTTVRACLEKYAIPRGTWYDAVRRGDIPRAPKRGRSIAEMAGIKSRSLRGQLKRKLISSGTLQECCAICGLRSWRGDVLVFVLDHINGVNDDNALSNLRLLCPNCNSQTETFAGRNVKRVYSLGSRQAA